MHAGPPASVSRDRAISGAIFTPSLHSDERTPKAGGPTEEFYGKVLLILKRQPDGSWKKYIDIANDDAPPK